jgi:hypothetical protein
LLSAKPIFLIIVINIFAPIKKAKGWAKNKSKKAMFCCKIQKSTVETINSNQD